MFIVIFTIFKNIIHNKRPLTYRIYFDFAPLRSIRRPFERNEEVRQMKSKTNVRFCKAPNKAIRNQN